MSSIFLSSGIGDFFAIISLMSKKEKEDVTKIYWATRARKGTEPFLPFVFPNLKEQIILCDDFTPSEDINRDPKNPEFIANFCVHSLDDLLNRFPLKYELSLEEEKEIVDLSMAKVATEYVHENRRRYHGIPELLERKLVDISKFELPEKFYYIHPWSDNQSYYERDFTKEDCERIINFLEKQNAYGVVVNKSTRLWEVKSDRIIDLTNQADMLESVEIMKKAIGFIGACSAFSVLATKLNYKISDIIMKGPSALRDVWYKFYYEPLKTNSYIYEELDFL